MRIEPVWLPTFGSVLVGGGGIFREESQAKLPPDARIHSDLKHGSNVFGSSLGLVLVLRGGSLILPRRAPPLKKTETTTTTSSRSLIYGGSNFVSILQNSKGGRADQPWYQILVFKGKVQKRSKSHPKMMPKSSQSHPKIILKLSQNDRKAILK